MWDLMAPQPVKLICGILASDTDALIAAVNRLEQEFGAIDLKSPVWPFDMTDYYRQQAGQNILRQFVAFQKLFEPEQLAAVKIKTNILEQELSEHLKRVWPRPVNLDPGYIEPSKLVLASTKNFAHRVYIGQQIWAEVTMIYVKGVWQTFPFTFPDFKSGRYNEFLSQARQKLVEQLKEELRQ